MGLEIKKNAKGQYQLKSTISDERLHKSPWISENEAKRILIERAYEKFVSSVIEIGFDFPSGYYVNDKVHFEEEKHCAGSKFILTNWNNDQVIQSKFEEICKEVGFEI